MAAGLVLNVGRFYWNVEANVGVNSPNKIQDVHLVQLAFHCISTNSKHPVPAEEKPIYAAVVPGAPYTGDPTDPLSVVIKHQQKKRGGVQDGHVSKMQPSGVYASDMTWMLVILNNNIADVLGIDWPFLDRHPKCTGPLKELVTRTFDVNFNL